MGQASSGWYTHVFNLSVSECFIQSVVPKFWISLKFLLAWGFLMYRGFKSNLGVFIAETSHPFLNSLYSRF